MAETKRRLPTLAEQIAGRCVHFSGMQHSACEVGIPYAEFKDPATKKRAAFSQVPCFAGDGRLPCERRQFPTPEEVAAEVAASDRFFENYKKARAAIMASVMARRGSGGSIDCPICGVLGSLVFSIAHNGHVHAKCRTAGCVAWME